MATLHQNRQQRSSTDEAVEEVFVFGSNLRGIHGAGAAKVAREHWGARMGVAEGRTGQSYALPTKVSPGRRMLFAELVHHVEVFIRHARSHPEITFLLTKVGCGLAGFEEGHVAPIFRHAPGNVVLIDESGLKLCHAHDWQRLIEGASEPHA